MLSLKLRVNGLMQLEMGDEGVACPVAGHDANQTAVVAEPRRVAILLAYAGEQALKAFNR